MKKALACMVVVFLLAVSIANAKVLRVGYNGQVAGVDYNNVNSAIDAATAGDTIQLYQNSNVGSARVDKRLVFVGFGYNLEKNPGLQAVPAAPNQVTLYFEDGAENSVASGIYGHFDIATNNITLSRCFGTVRIGYSPYTGSKDVSSVGILGSYLNIQSQWGRVSNALVTNSIISYWYCNNLDGLVNNNVFTGSIGAFGGCVVRNNIFARSNDCPSGGSSVFEKNLFAANCTVTGSGNKVSTDMNTVFVNWNNGDFGSESNIALKAGSPAKGFGTDNNGATTDAGIYGGDQGLVYKLSGIPAIPSIYKISAPTLSANANPYTISVSVRSNN